MGYCFFCKVHQMEHFLLLLLFLFLVFAVKIWGILYLKSSYKIFREKTETFPLP